MAHYRVYYLDGEGRIILADWIEAGDDVEAMRRAKKFGRADGIEVWDQVRLVGRFEPHKIG